MTTDLDFPPWTFPATEVVSVDKADFSAMDTTIDALAKHMHGAVLSRTYVLSPDWGKLVQAKLSMSGHAIIVNCWAATGDQVQIATMVDEDEP